MVTFYDGSTSIGAGTLAGGKATLKTTTLPVGSETITVAYGGDSNFLSSSSAVLIQTVHQDSTTTRLTSSVNPSVYGQTVVFTATVAASAPGSGTPTGTVTFFLDGSNALGSGTLTGGAATITTAALAVGSHVITAVYNSDPNFTGSTSSGQSQRVKRDGTTTSVVSSLNPSSVGQSVTFTASISAMSPGSGTPTGDVTFYVNSIDLGTFALSSGSASYTVIFTSSGSDTIKVVYGGDAEFKRSTATFTQIVL